MSLKVNLMFEYPGAANYDHVICLIFNNGCLFI